MFWTYEIVPDPFERYVERETFAEIMALLDPEELVIAALRLEELCDGEVAALLDTSRQAICQRMQAAQEGIMARRPDLAPVLRGRQRRPEKRQRRQKHPPPPPLERGWICRWPPEASPGDDETGAGDLTIAEVAECCGVAVQTVRRWLHQGRFPHAYRGRRKGRAVWLIPKGDVDGVVAGGGGQSGGPPVENSQD